MSACLSRKMMNLRWSRHRERDIWLGQSSEKLLEQCVCTVYQASGPGGQKRNRKYSAVRVSHLPSGLEVTSCDSRSQNVNRKHAMHKLRRRIAMHVRGGEPSPVPSFEMSRGNPLYPGLLAAIFDALDMCGFNFKDAADALGVSTSRLLKTLQDDPEAWQVAQQRSRMLKEQNQAGPRTDKDGRQATGDGDF